MSGGVSVGVLTPEALLLEWKAQDGQWTGVRCTEHTVSFAVFTFQSYLMCTRSPWGSTLGVSQGLQFLGGRLSRAPWWPAPPRRGTPRSPFAPSVRVIFTAVCVQCPASP